MIPSATLADLDDVYLELAVFGCHFIEFPALLDPALVLAKLVSVHVGDVRQPDLAAYWAPGVGWFAVELGRPKQIRMRVADIGDRGASGQHRSERRAPRQRVVDHRSPHDRQVTTESRLRRVPSLPLRACDQPAARHDSHRLPGQLALARLRTYLSDVSTRYIERIRNRATDVWIVVQTGSSCPAGYRDSRG